MGPIGCPETSVQNYHYSLRNNREERSSHLKCTGFEPCGIGRSSMRTKIRHASSGLGDLLPHPGNTRQMHIERNCSLQPRWLHATESGTLGLQPMQLEGSAKKRGFMSVECRERIRRNVKPASVVTSTAAFATSCVFVKHAHDNKRSGNLACCSHVWLIWQAFVLVKILDPIPKQTMVVHLTCSTFSSLAVTLLTTGFNIQTICMVLCILHGSQTNNNFYFIQHELIFF
jgi:hypothetical protein